MRDHSPAKTTFKKINKKSKTNSSNNNKSIIFPYKLILYQRPHPSYYTPRNKVVVVGGGGGGGGYIEITGSVCLPFCPAFVCVLSIRYLLLLLPLFYVHRIRKDC